MKKLLFVFWMRLLNLLYFLINILFWSLVLACSAVVLAVVIPPLVLFLIRQQIKFEVLSWSFLVSLS
jgi:hypothetical protein